MELDVGNLVVGALVGILTWIVGEKSVRAAKHQTLLSASTIATDWLRDLRSWAGEAVDVLAEASYTCRRSDPTATLDEQAVLLRCRFRLSALIDRGRFLLPNEREREIGSHKAAAYTGLRHPALDALVAAERVLGGDIALESFPDRKSALIGLRREFVSIIQAILDPRTANKMVARLLREAQEERQKDPTLGGLLPHPELRPTGAAGLLYAASRRYEEAAPARRSSSPSAT